jgi:hypothetical protein
MNPDIRVELTRDLEKIKQSNVLTSSRWLFVFGVIIELIVGVWFIGGSSRLFFQADSGAWLFSSGYLILLIGILLLAHAAYLVVMRFVDRKLRALYEAVLDTDRKAV